MAGYYNITVFFIISGNFGVFFIKYRKARGMFRHCDGEVLLFGQKNPKIAREFP